MFFFKSTLLKLSMLMVRCGTSGVEQWKVLVYKPSSCEFCVFALSAVIGNDNACLQHFSGELVLQLLFCWVKFLCITPGAVH